MCGIVGLFLKDKTLEPALGQLMGGMLTTMSDRGPDSAGFAVYGAGTPGRAKITVQSADPETAFSGLGAAIGEALGAEVGFARRSSHGVLDVPAERSAETRQLIRDRHPALRVMAAGEAIEIYKEVGLPTAVARRFDLEAMTGTHGIGHTRMATESAVTTLGAHPFSTGADQCLVHNGSLSNHNNLRRQLTHDGITLETRTIARWRPPI